MSNRETVARMPDIAQKAGAQRRRRIMTPLIILGAIVTGFAAIYIYIANNKESFVRKNEPPKDPFNVIYLPADLDAEKNIDEPGNNKPENKEV